MVTTVATVLFVVQIVATALFGGGQLLKMYKTRKGVSVSWFILWEGFLLMNLALTYQAYLKNDSWPNAQAVIGYALWVVVVAADLAVIVWFGLVAWDRYETRSMMIGVGGILAVLLAAHVIDAGITSPFVKGGLAFFCKTTSQLVFALKIRAVGRGGLAGLTLIMGHMTVMSRVGQIVCALVANGEWEPNLTASLVSELGNEVSWIVVTICWLRWRKPQPQ